MRLLDKLLGKTETRANPENPSTNLSDPDTWLYEALGARTALTGVSVTPENSLELAPVWAAVRLISSTLATLPLPVYRHVDGGKEKARQHPLYRLLHDRPNPDMSSFTFREMVAAHLLLYGNAFVEIERNGAGMPIALWPIHPALYLRTERINGRKVQVFRGKDAREIPLVVSDQVLHIPGFGLDGHGLIPTSVARNSLGLAKATESYGSKFFGNGATPSGIIQHPGKLTAEAAERLKTSWNTAHASLDNAQRTAVLEHGMTFQPLSLPPEHAQFLQTRRYSISEVSRLFLVPPSMLSDLERATFSNIEHLSIQFVQHCVMPWCRRIEQELNYALFPDAEYFAEFQLSGLLRGDSTARAAYYTALFNIGALSPNDIREMENMNKVEGGDDRFRPLNMSILGEEVPAESPTDAADRALIEEAVTRSMEAMANAA